MSKTYCRFDSSGRLELQLGSFLPFLFCLKSSKEWQGITMPRRRELVCSRAARHHRAQVANVVDYVYQFVYINRSSVERPWS